MQGDLFRRAREVLLFLASYAGLLALRSCAMPHGCSRLLVCLALLAACSTLRDDLRRAEGAFTEARYEDVEVWLGDLAPSVPRMSAEERARYYYLAGMSAYRMGKRARARHALALCREELELGRVSLPAGWQRNLELALSDLTSGARGRSK